MIAKRDANVVDLRGLTIRLLAGQEVPKGLEGAYRQAVRDAGQDDEEETETKAAREPARDKAQRAPARDK